MENEKKTSGELEVRSPETKLEKPRPRPKKKKIHRQFKVTPPEYKLEKPRPHPKKKKSTKNLLKVEKGVSMDASAQPQVPYDEDTIFLNKLRAAINATMEHINTSKQKAAYRGKI